MSPEEINVGHVPNTDYCGIVFHPRGGLDMAMGSENAAIVTRVEGKGSRRRLWAWVFRWLLELVSVEPDWISDLRKLSEKGTVVHVVLKLSLLELLLIDQLCRLHDLPPIKLVIGAGRYASWPLRWILSLFWRRCRSCEASEATALAEHRETSLLVLRPNGAAGSKRSNAGQAIAETTERLVALQRSLDYPITLVPHAVFWGRRRQGSSKRAFWSWWRQQLLEGPGLLRLMARVARSRREAQIHMIKPIELNNLIEESPEDSDQEVAQRARFELRRRIEQERKVVLGPMAKSDEVTRDEVLRNVSLNDELQAIAESRGVPIEKLRRRAKKVLREIQAIPKSGYLAAANAFLWWVWSRVFEGIEIDREGLARLREAAHEGPLVVVSSHRSHVDYLILHQVFWESGMFPPHIAAGRNLSFWPIGAIFRGCGAFFIRRHFIEDKLYVAVLQAYITKILQEGYNLEFFIEGTRSRSGKMMPPKVGMLGMAVEAARRLKGYKVRIAPVSVIYSRVPEEGAFADEAGGGEKKSEDIGGLLKTRHAFRRRHGVLYVQFGNPLDVEEFFTEQGVEADRAVNRAEWRRIVSNLAYRTVHEINRVTAITPTALVATALLLNRRRGMTHSTLRAEANRLVESLDDFDATFSASLKGASQHGLPEQVLLNAVGFLAEAKLLAVHNIDDEAIYTVSAERRVALDFYKNSTLHPLVNALMVASSIGPVGGEGRDWEELADRVRFLSRLLKYEFVYRADAVFEVNLVDTVEKLVSLGQLGRRDGRVFIPGHAARKAIQTYRSMVENFIESYWIVIRQLRQVGEQLVGEKELAKLTLAQGERMYLVGEIENRESRSKTNFQNAIKSLLDLRVLERRDGKHLAVTDLYLKPLRLARLERRVVSYLHR